MKEILGRELDYRFDRQHLKSAKELVNPGPDVKALDPEIVRMCLLAMKSGELPWPENRPIVSLYAVTWGDPPYYSQMLCKIAQIPPIYEVRNYDSWVLRFGRKAAEIGAWDGRFAGWENPLEMQFRITPPDFIAAMAGAG